MMIHSSKDHFEPRMTLPFQTRFSSISTRQTTGDSSRVQNTVKKNNPSNPMTSQQIQAFLVDSGEDLHREPSSTFRVQTKCKSSAKRLQRSIDQGTTARYQGNG